MNMKRDISRKFLVDKATSVVNAPYTATDEEFYHSTKWVKTRDEYNKANPFCELCLSEGKHRDTDDVHHITPLTAGGEPFSEGNLIALCDSCHSGIHGSGGIAVELDILNPFGSEDHTNNFTTKLKRVDSTVLSQCKEGDTVILVRKRRVDDIQHISVSTTNAQRIGDVDPSDAAHHYLAHDIDHGTEVSATIEKVIINPSKTECFVHISKNGVDWDAIDKFSAKEKSISEVIQKAKQCEETDCGLAIQAYREASEMLIQLDRDCDKYPMPWRSVRIPIYRLSLILEKRKRYRECLNAIESYQAYEDKVWLYAGEWEKIEKRKARVLRLLNAPVSN
jgi:hypothetical protein